MARKHSLKKLLRDNGLSLVLVALFLAFWTGQAITGFQDHYHEEQSHGRPTVAVGAYLLSGHFWEATFENWESEFLQMAAYVLLTVCLYQRGSAESRDPDEMGRVPPAGTNAGASKSWRKWIYEHSLSLALGSLFLLSWCGHALAGWKHYNGEQSEHGGHLLTFAQYLGAARFWFESFQNWQSEFLAVATIVILSIWLREKDSPESKKLSSTNQETGK